MFTDEISFAIMLCVSCGFAAWFAYRNGKEYALGAGMAVSLLAGTWFEITIGGVEINVTMATAIILLIVYCTHSWREIFKSLHLLDYLIATLALWHWIVDVYHDGQPLAFAVQAYGQWILPYAAGRYAFLHRGSLSKLAPVFVSVATFISIAAIYESCTSWNLWQEAFVHVDDKVRSSSNARYGLLFRAIGPVRHPIFLGIVLFSLLPFAVDVASRQELSKWRRTAAVACILTIVMGILATVSRGPLLCLALALAFALAWYHAIARWCLIAATAAAAIFVVTQFDVVLRYLDATENDQIVGRVIQVDDRANPEIYTGTRNRIFVIKIYAPLVAKGGAMGYGTLDSTGFPPRNLPGLPTDPRVRDRLGTVDNSYINIGLRLGWVGMGLFVCLLVTAIAFALRLAPVASTYLYPSDHRVLIALASVLFALMLEISTVFFSYDYAFWLLFQIGVVAGLASQCARIRRGDEQ